MDVQINWVAVVLAMISSMVVGSVWYMPAVFGKSWSKMVGMTKEKQEKGAGKAIAVTVVVSFISAFVLAHMTYISSVFYNESFMVSAFTTAFWLWLGFTAARFITHDAFEQRPTKLTVMNVAHELVTFMVMALIIGALKP